MSELRHGSVRDCNVDYTLARKYIWAKEYQIHTLTTSGGGGSVGSPDLRVMSNSGVQAWHFDAQGDAVSVPVMFYDIDPRQPVYFRHLWTTPNLGVADINRFRTQFQSLTTSSSIQTATVPLTTVITSSTKGAAPAFAPTWSPWGAIQSKTTGILTGQIFPDDTYGLFIETALQSSNQLNVELAKAGGGVLLVATEIAYTPRQTFGDGSRREARYLESPLSFKEAGPSQDLP